MRHNDPRLVAAIKEAVTRSVTKRVHEAVDKIDMKGRIYDGDSISLTYTYDVDAGAVRLLAAAVGIELPPLPEDHNKRS